MELKLDTRGVWYCKNIVRWFDGTIRPGRGHNGRCYWLFDGQFYVHQPHTHKNKGDK